MKRVLPIIIADFNTASALVKLRSKHGLKDPFYEIELNIGPNDE